MRNKVAALEPYTPRSRSDALEEFQKKCPSLFPDWPLEEATLRTFLMDPVEHWMRQSLNGYWRHVSMAHPPLLPYWDLTRTNPPFDLLQEVLQLEAIIKPGQYKDRSLNGMWLYKAQMRSQWTPLSAMTDGRTTVIIKSQAIRLNVDSAMEDKVGATTDGGTKVTIKPRDRDNFYHSVFEFTNEVVIARLLNTLVTGFEYTVTPHFTTFLGAFACNEITSLEGDIHPTNKRIHAIFERADRSIEDFFKGLTKPPIVFEFGALLFQLLSALEAGCRLAGLVHRDLNSGNWMLRQVEGTAYADRIWSYKRFGRETFYFITPEYHRNRFIEIIDFGRSTIADGRKPSVERAAQGFTLDVLYVLNDLLVFSEAWETDDDDDAWTTVRNLLYETQTSLSDEKTQRQFFAHWPESKLGQVLFTPFVKPRNMADPQTPLVVGYVPQGTLVDAPGRGRDVRTVREVLPRLWKLQNAEKTRYSRQCVGCFSSAAHKTTVDDKETFFCGHDCYSLHYGLYDHI